MENRNEVQEFLAAKEFMDQMRKHNLVFWAFKKQGIVLFYYNLIRFLNVRVGISLCEIFGNTHLCQVTDNVIRVIDGTGLRKILVQYIERHFPKNSKEITASEVLNLITETSRYSLEKNALDFLPHIEGITKHDTKEACFFFYQNCIIKITADSVEEIACVDFENKVFEGSIIPRRYRRHLNRKRGEFKQFVWNLCGRERNRYLSLMAALGYLLHQYKDPANPKIVILIDQIIGEEETHNGGTGKSLLFKALSYMRNMVELSGKKKGSPRFLMQRVDAFTDLILVNDVGRHESIENWYNYSADDFTIERKYKTEVVVPASLSPKICMTTNHMIKRPEGNSSERRLQEYEVSDYYGADRSPQDEFGHSLFYDWDQLQWQLFDQFMVQCVQLYLKHGLIAPPKINIEKRKLLLEVGVELKEFLDEKIEQGQTKFHKKDTFDEFRKGGFADPRFVPRQNKFTRKVKRYIQYNHIPYREVPADRKLYIEIITENTLNNESIRSLKDFDTDYKLVDSENKVTRMSNRLNQQE